MALSSSQHQPEWDKLSMSGSIGALVMALSRSDTSAPGEILREPSRLKESRAGRFDSWSVSSDKLWGPEEGGQGKGTETLRTPPSSRSVRFWVTERADCKQVQSERKARLHELMTMLWYMEDAGWTVSLLDTEPSGRMLVGRCREQEHARVQAEGRNLN